MPCTMSSTALVATLVLLLAPARGTPADADSDSDSAWSRLGDGPAPVRFGHAAAVTGAANPLGGTAHAFGGCAAYGGAPVTPAGVLKSAQPLGDEWERAAQGTAGKWQPDDAGGVAPSNRSLAASTVDVSLDDYWFLYGGVDSTASPRPARTARSPPVHSCCRLWLGPFHHTFSQVLAFIQRRDLGGLHPHQ